MLHAAGYALAWGGNPLRILAASIEPFVFGVSKKLRKRQATVFSTQLRPALSRLLVLTQQAQKSPSSPPFPSHTSAPSAQSHYSHQPN